MIKDRELMKSTTYSFLLHCLLLVLIAYNGFKMPGGGSAQGELGTEQQAQESSQTNTVVQVEIIDPPKEKSEETTKEDEEGVGLVQPTHLEDQCADFFGGIGITQSGDRDQYGFTTQMRIMQIHSGYPAEKAGLKVGDVIVSTNEIRGEIGTPVTVEVIREGQLLRFQMIRDKICTTPPTQGAKP